MLSGKSGTIQVEKGTASITTITRAKSGNLLVVSWQFVGFVTGLTKGIVHILRYVLMERRRGRRVRGVEG